MLFTYCCMNVSHGLIRSKSEVAEVKRWALLCGGGGGVGWWVEGKGGGGGGGCKSIS